MNKSSLWVRAAFMLLFLVSGITVLAHGDEDHKKQDSTTRVENVQDNNHASTAPQNHASESTKPVQANFDDFPNLHPLLVHFPIVLLLLAALLAIGNIFFSKKELDWVVTIVIGLGALGAYAAGRWFHPHAHDLTAHMQAVLDQHDLYADWTIWLSITAFVLQLISQFILKQKRWAVILVSLVLIGAAYTVSQAGHYGSQLVHIEGVGPQGNYLETEENHNH
ncbi:MAG: hypothetical protein U5L96_06965 [Owenweeksia sp.]|nr:hypothetical protein [Owenweeksia sp.]